jgi:transposase-like protein
VLVELSKVEQKYDGVLSVFRDGLTISEAHLTYGVSCQNIYRWMHQFGSSACRSLLHIFTS